MLLFDPPGTWKLAKSHRAWLVACLVLGFAAFGWYAATWAMATDQPGGSSLPGLVCGVLGGLVMLYLFAYALRKLPGFRLYFARRPTKVWLRQHIWLGLLTLPFVLVHAARITHWGTLTIALISVYALVMISGIWGLFLQQRLPTRLLEDIPDETIRSQIPELTEQLRQEAELLVLAACGPPAGSQALPTLRQHLAVIRAARSGKGSGLLAVLPAEPIPDSEPLRRYFEQTIDPFLQASRSGAVLRTRFDKDFRDLHGRLPGAAKDVLDALQGLCERRRQFDEQARLHGFLHVWIGFHLSLSALLLVLLTWHAVTAVLYW